MPRGWLGTVIKRIKRSPCVHNVLLSDRDTVRPTRTRSFLETVWHVAPCPLFLSGKPKGFLFFLSLLSPFPTSALVKEFLFMHFFCLLTVLAQLIEALISIFITASTDSDPFPFSTVLPISPISQLVPDCATPTPSPAPVTTPRFFNPRRFLKQLAAASPNKFLISVARESLNWIGWESKWEWERQVQLMGTADNRCTEKIWNLRR